MAFITKNDIVDGAIIVADFFRRIIDALDGTSETDIKIKGELQLEKDKLKINNVVVNTTAEELNGLANRIAGIVEANKPIVVGSNKNIDYLKVQQLEAEELILAQPDVSGVAGKVFAYQNFV